MQSARPIQKPKSLLRRVARGLSLVELMVSIAIGMLIVASLALLFSNSSLSRGEAERTSQRIDNGRYALELLAQDLQNAGYFAEFDPRQLNLPSDKPDPCLTGSADLASALRLHVQGYDDVATNVLSCISDVKAGTDVVVVRRANGCVSGAAGCTAIASGDFAFQASSCNSASELANGSALNYFALASDLSALSRTKKDCTTVADIRRYLIRIYFIASNDKPGDGIPTLKRVEFTAGAWAAVSLVQGIENMQIEHGLDTNTDGSADVYTPSPDTYLSCSNLTNPTCAQQWASVVTAKITLLSRNLEQSPGHSDTKVYTLGQFADGPSGASGSDKPVGPFNDAYKRNLYQQLIRFQNVSGRNGS